MVVTSHGRGDLGFRIGSVSPVRIPPALCFAGRFALLFNAGRDLRVVLLPVRFIGAMLISPFEFHGHNIIWDQMKRSSRLIIIKLLIYLDHPDSSFR